MKQISNRNNTFIIFLEVFLFSWSPCLYAIRTQRPITTENFKLTPLLVQILQNKHDRPLMISNDQVVDQLDVQKNMAKTNRNKLTG